MTKLQFTSLVVALSIVWAAMLLSRGVAVSFAMLAPLSSVAGMGFALIQLFDKFVWRWRLLHPWVVKRPVIDGTWKGLLVSDYVDPQTSQVVAPIVAYFRVVQTYSTLHLRLMTAESSSDLLAGNVYSNGDESFDVAGVYLNTPKADVAHRSPIHHGGLRLKVQGDPGERLEGHYWTSRKTTGTLVFDKRIEGKCETFAQADQAFSQQVQSR